jgi:hypothetical protein
MLVIVPALLAAGFLSFFVMSSPAHAAELAASSVLATSTTATSTSPGAVTASTSGSTLPDPSQKTIHITRTDVLTSTEGISSSTPAVAIHTSTQLAAYALLTLQGDPYMNSISLSGESITVSYRRNGRLLGLVPIALPSQVTVYTDGSVTFSEPWYSFATVEDKDRMRTGLEVRVHSLLTSEGYLASMSLAPATQAEILDIIHDLLA